MDNLHSKSIDVSEKKPLCGVIITLSRPRSGHLSSSGNSDSSISRPAARINPLSNAHARSSSQIMAPRPSLMSIEPDHPVEMLFILQLVKDGSYKLIELEVQNELAEACIALHQALKNKKRTRKDEKMIKTKLGNSTLQRNFAQITPAYASGEQRHSQRRRTQQAETTQNSVSKSVSKFDVKKLRQMSQFFNISLNFLTLKKWNFPDKTKKNRETSMPHGFTIYGGRYKTRTCDLPHVKRMRYQLRQSSSSLTACLDYLRKRKLSIPFFYFFQDRKTDSPESESLLIALSCA